MLKFFAGVLIGLVLAISYVRFNVQLPPILQLPNDLRGGVISAATENDLYDLDGDEQRRRRALEVFFANRPGAAAEADAEAGYPFLKSLQAARAAKEARQFRSQWNGFDAAIEKPGLRAALERQYGTRDADQLKRAMLFEELTARPFLKQWLEENGGPIDANNVYERITSAASSKSD
jgi:hypothetical protein